MVFDTNYDLFFDVCSEWKGKYLDSRCYVQYLVPHLSSLRSVINFSKIFIRHRICFLNYTKKSKLGDFSRTRIRTGVQNR